MNYLNKILPAVFVAIVIILIACRKEDTIDSSAGLKLSFSTDTVFFDTIFPTIGSVTHRLIVYNPNDNKVAVSQIELAGGNISSYRINVDGLPGIAFSDTEIPGHDSIFIFVKVTIDPQNTSLPFVVKDSIRFLTNGSNQYVRLVAWGREAIFHKNGIISGNTVWDSTRAHVIYGSVRVDTGSMLTITEGTRVYFHYGSYMAVSPNGTLKVNGTISHPVTFCGDRLDPFYRDLTGQWNGIFLESGSNGNIIENTRIKNGTYGIVADQSKQPGQTMLTLQNVAIENMTGNGIYAMGSSIAAVNCMIADCGRGCLDIVYGGQYDFRHLTVANYWYTTVRKSPSVSLSNYSYDTTGQKIFNPLTKAYFGNAILFGSNDEELGLDSVAGTEFSYYFDHSLLRTEGSVTGPHFENCLKNQDPVFVDIQKMDYRIDSISPAIDRGKEMGVPFDLLGIPRSNPPDLGAYEYQKKK